mmetsp:Transcript_19376/g.45178  ORF Transcript_19376/g.45178 Transcript_19376/m.45178 type:complete len:228 (-) Transcript_19376:2-685(-)
MHRLLLLVHHLHALALPGVKQHECQLRAGHGDKLLIAEAARRAEQKVPDLGGLASAAERPLQVSGPCQGVEPGRIVAGCGGLVRGAGKHAEDQHIVDLRLPGEAVCHAKDGDGLLPSLVELLRGLRCGVEGVEGGLEVASGVEPLSQAALLEQGARHTGIGTVLLELLRQSGCGPAGVGRIKLGRLTAVEAVHMGEEHRKACHGCQAKRAKEWAATEHRACCLAERA